MRRTRRLDVPARRGVTLIELTVSLMIAALTLVSGRLLVESIADSGSTLSRFTRASDAYANGDRLLRSLVGRAEPSTDSIRRFHGQTQSASFDTWCERPAGWLERCRASLTIGAALDSSLVTAVLSTGEILSLYTVAGSAQFRYATRDSSGIHWLASWGQSITAPLAIAIESRGDTLVLIVGERG